MIILGLGWFLGWNDGCGSADTAEYESNMVNLIKDLRKEFGNPKMAVSIPVSGFDGWMQGNTRRLVFAMTDRWTPRMFVCVLFSCGDGGRWSCGVGVEKPSGAEAAPAPSD